MYLPPYPFLVEEARLKLELYRAEAKLSRIISAAPSLPSPAWQKLIAVFVLPHHLEQANLSSDVPQTILEAKSDI